MSTDQQSIVQSFPALDATDSTIVSALLHDGRQSVPQLAEEAGLGRATAYSRFDSLTERGVIEGFSVRINPEAVGLGVSALVLATAEQSQWDGLERALMELYGVQWVGLAAGSFDFIIIVRAADLAELRDVVLHELLRLPGISSTQTSVLLRELRPPNAIL